MGALAKVTSKGQVTLPAAMPEEFGIQPGDQILDAIDRLQRHANIILDDPEAVSGAIGAWRTGKPSLASGRSSASAERAPR
jgi:AbrB family looped-hinge helix DNA binding protein